MFEPFKKKPKKTIFIQNFLIGIAVAWITFYLLPLDRQQINKFSDASKVICILPGLLGTSLYQSNNVFIEHIGLFFVKWAIVLTGMAFALSAYLIVTHKY